MRVNVVPYASRSTPAARVDVRISTCIRSRCASSASSTRPSANDAKDDASSSRTTREPRDAKSEAYSRPIGPAPTIVSLAGSVWSSSRSSGPTTVRPSNSTVVGRCGAGADRDDHASCAKRARPDPVGDRERVRRVEAGTSRDERDAERAQRGVDACGLLRGDSIGARPQLVERETRTSAQGPAVRLALGRAGRIRVRGAQDATREPRRRRPGCADRRSPRGRRARQLAAQLRRLQGRRRGRRCRSRRSSRMARCASSRYVLARLACSMVVFQSSAPIGASA